MLFQIIFIIKYLRRSLSLVELYAYSSFTKTELFHRDLEKIEQLVEQLLVAASETREFKHIYQIRKRDSVSLVYERLLTSVTSI